MENVKDIFNNLNAVLSKYGFPEILMVSPDECLPQKKNAHYFKAEKFQQLITNIKNDGFLASIPLVRRENGKFRIIDGTHRVDGSKAAGLDKILVFVYEPKTEDEAISKQLSFNSLVGQDDKLILTELFNSIKDINCQIATGLSSEIIPISYTSLSFKLAAFKELTFLFIPTDIDDYDKIYNEIAEHSFVKSSAEVRISNIDYYEKFTHIIRRVKKVDNIKNNGTALLRILEYAQMFLDTVEEQP